MASGTMDDVATPSVSGHPRRPRQCEAEYAARWRAGEWLNQTFTTLDGQRYTLLYQGRPGTGSGPDFRDAVLAADGERVCGDIELHLRPGNWQAHGHQRDQRYNGVVLHVVVARGTSHEQATLRANGTRAPITVLPGGDTLPQPRRRVWPCQALVGATTARDWRTLLVALGEARLHERAAALGAALRQPWPVAAHAPRWSPTDVVLWLALAEALGYGRDRDAMRAAGWRMIASPLPRATNVVVRNVLIPPAPFPVRGEGGASGATCGPGSPSPPQRRGGQGVRMAQVPTTEMPGEVGASLLDGQRAGGLQGWFDAWREYGPWNALEPMLRDGAERAVGVALARALTNAAGGVGTISPGRAAIVVANVALPFALAMADRTDDHELARRAHGVYAALPGLPSNTITRLLSRQFGLARLPTGAQAQQGLQHVWARWCREKRCEGCPVASHVSGIKIAARAGS